MPSYLSNINAAYIEELEQKYHENPGGIDPSWRYFFDGLSVQQNLNDPQAQAGSTISRSALEFEIKVMQLIQGYREMGYLIADINPLDRGVKTHRLLKLENFGLTENELNSVCQIGHVLGLGAIPLSEIIKNLKSYYCSAATVEYEHIDDPQTREWIRRHAESGILSQPVDKETKLQALQKLCEAEVFESFLHRRFVGQKRFSGEGVDAIIPFLDYVIEQAAEVGADEILLGMAHRGRLCVLANIFKKDLNVMFAEFSGNLSANVGDGDVKYHMGFSKNIKTKNGKTVHLSLLPNPSHLEAVNAVVVGTARAKQGLKQDAEQTKVIPILLHGDASFAGQGSVYELLNMSELEGYHVGGTIHVILNNQVGFTTNPRDARSTPHSTDVAKMLEVPIFRVNGDEVEAVIQVAALALKFRQEFKRDVVIDLMGYRRYGHNEGDEPTFTQPLMYQLINNHPRVFDIFARRLVQNKVVEQSHVDGIVNEFTSTLEDALVVSKEFKISSQMHSFGDRWKSFHKGTEVEVFKSVKTEVSLESLKSVGEKILASPMGFNVHPKIKKLIEDRKEMVEGRKPIDWSVGEAFAFGTLIQDGYKVRLSGQDCERGTFSHRHAVFNDVVTGAKYVSLDPKRSFDPDFEVVNSLLSEYAVLGFEFGQSISNPRKLTLWEAQFGDFANGAQIIIDQFITTSAAKWQRYSGLVMLLPHGYEGQGPEHSSGRLERFLQACSQNNIQVCNLTTPAQYFHVLRRQMLRDFRLPLIVMSPKSLLRSPAAVSSLEDFQKGHFQEVIDDVQIENKKKAKRIVFVVVRFTTNFWTPVRRVKTNQSKISLLFAWSSFTLSLKLVGKKFCLNIPTPRKLSGVRKALKIWKVGVLFFRE
ncbi:MAG: 2-oxoglutarate dehydrogenase E1 component [Deltaproteobacteria bacterium]|nr:MAG: 2-oxoglutarate dehydrogenase E1 component [Deltaproteobacteria bacterium]